MAAEQVRELVRLDAQLKASKAELKAAVLATGSRLMDLYGVGPVNAARILADVGDVARFPTKARFASCNGTPHPRTPPPASRSATACRGRGTEG